MFENVWKLSRLMHSALANRLFINICVCLRHDTMRWKLHGCDPELVEGQRMIPIKNPKGKQIQRINHRKLTPPAPPQKSTLNLTHYWDPSQLGVLFWGCGVNFLWINEDKWIEQEASQHLKLKVASTFDRRLHHSIIIDVFERRDAFLRCFSLSLGFCEPEWI